MSKSCIILAAGDGKRMNSSKPKVLLEVLFRPMLEWVLDSAEFAGINKNETGVIVGNEKEQIIKYLASREESNGKKYQVFEQKERLGTGHAVYQGESLLTESAAKNGDVLILCGDAPFMSSEIINEAYGFHKSCGYDATVITSDVFPINNCSDYGRIKRDSVGNLLKIIEKKDCTKNELVLTEMNSGAYWFKSKKLLEVLPKIQNKNNSKEYYLTDTIELLSGNAGAYKTTDSLVILGANDREQLRFLNDKMTEKINSSHYKNGVDIVGHNVIIGKNVKISRDTTIMPNTIIIGNTVINCGCVIGPNSYIDNCEIGENVTLNNVQAFSSKIKNNVKIGPFVHIRPGTVINSGVKIGDFVEVKNSEIGEKTAIAHLTYIGDSDVGKNVNFGCGCVTANYDGIKKFRTKIGDNAFIGCNTNLIAPVEIGDNATTAAGSTITKNVPANALALERASTTIKQNWYKNSARISKLMDITEK